jgi:TolA-binding protein
MRQLVLAVLGASLTAVAAAAGPLSPTAPRVERDVTVVQDRLLPRFFGGGDDERERERAAAALRIEQLEQQVRMLTGQVEELTFTVRRLERALEAQGSLPPRTGAPVVRRDDPSATSARSTTSGTPPARVPAETGPLDLSAINRGAVEPVSPAPSRRAADPVTTPGLDQVRELQRSGRYAMAAQEARKVLTDNPTGPVAAEARYLLGEALLAQGSFRNAANLFLENYTSDPSGVRAPASLLKLSAALNSLGEREAACSSLEELFGAYPNVDPELRAAAERERQAAGCT